MAAIALASALLGMNRIVKVLGSIGPVAIVFLIIIALPRLAYQLGKHLQRRCRHRRSGHSVVRGVGDSSSWWIIGAVMYVAYNILAGVLFISKMGTEAASQKEAILGGLFGGVLLGLCAFCLNLAMLSNLQRGQRPGSSRAAVRNHDFSRGRHGIRHRIAGHDLQHRRPHDHLGRQSDFSSEEKDPVKVQGHHRRPRHGHAGRRPAAFFHLVNVIYPFVGYFGIAFMVDLVQYIRWHFSPKKSE